MGPLGFRNRRTEDWDRKVPLISTLSAAYDCQLVLPRTPTGLAETDRCARRRSYQGAAAVLACGKLSEFPIARRATERLTRRSNAASAVRPC